jgi:hypothetical protein
MTYNLLLGVLIRRQQIDRFHVPKINVMTKQEYKQQLANIFLLLIAVQRFVA